jgi:hypothetical protein
MFFARDGCEANLDKTKAISNLLQIRLLTGNQGRDAPLEIVLDVKTKYVTLFPLGKLGETPYESSTLFTVTFRLFPVHFRCSTHANTLCSWEFPTGFTYLT